MRGHKRSPELTWIRPDWPVPAQVRALSTTRQGGVSSGPWHSLNVGDQVGDMPACVHENRRRLQTLGELPQAPQWLHQVHGTELVTCPKPGLPKADASMTAQPGVVLAILTADCLPLLLCNRAGTEIAAVHCGWRCVAGGLVAKTVAALHSEPGELLAWLGPAIGPSQFAVGADVYEAMLIRDELHAAAFQPYRDRWLADLPQLVRHELALAGVTACYASELCTYQDAEQFFSYRRDQVTGRQATCIWLQPNACE